MELDPRTTGRLPFHDPDEADPHDLVASRATPRTDDTRDPPGPESDLTIRGQVNPAKTAWTFRISAPRAGVGGALSTTASSMPDSTCVTVRA